MAIFSADCLLPSGATASSIPQCSRTIESRKHDGETPTAEDTHH
jgi:hypothetical protein